MLADEFHNWYNFTGRVALVSGGAGALLAPFSRRLAALGARVILIGRSHANTLPLLEQARADGSEIEFMAADVTSKRQLEYLYNQILERYPRIDYLVNGAGSCHPAASPSVERPFFELDAQEAGDAYALNFTSALLCSQVFGRAMVEQGSGAIVNIVSTAALRPQAGIPAYSAVGAALLNFTAWLAAHMAREYSPGIRVNAVAPGFFLAEETRDLLTDPQTGALTPRGSAVIAHTPLGRFGQPDDISGALLWLLSPAARFVTGAVIPVDGGFSAFSGV